jgi:hypothetical protein
VGGRHRLFRSQPLLQTLIAATSLRKHVLDGYVLALLQPRWVIGWPDLAAKG